MSEVRRTFTAEFKLAAIRLLTVSKLSLAEAARQLDIGQNLLRRSKDEYQIWSEEAFPGNGNLPPEQEELQARREEVHRLRVECDVLKKATAYFARAIV